MWLRVLLGVLMIGTMIWMLWPRRKPQQEKPKWQTHPMDSEEEEEPVVIHNMDHLQTERLQVKQTHGMLQVQQPEPRIELKQGGVLKAANSGAWLHAGSWDATSIELKEGFHVRLLSGAVLKYKNETLTGPIHVFWTGQEWLRLPLQDQTGTNTHGH